MSIRWFYFRILQMAIFQYLSILSSLEYLMKKKKKKKNLGALLRKIISRTRGICLKITIVTQQWFGNAGKMQKKKKNVLIFVR